jgi:hypothetical protein
MVYVLLQVYPNRINIKTLACVFFLVISCSLHAQDNYGDYIPFDSIFFERNTIPFNLDPPLSGNCWQVGHPSKSFFNQSYSLPLAIVTDSLLPYPPNSNSSFSFSFFYYAHAVYMEFLHKVDSDTITDFGTVEVSYDQGATWEVLKDSTCQNFGCVQLFWSDDSVLLTGIKIPHSPEMSGHSNGWVRSRFTWWWDFPVNKDSNLTSSDTITIRFSFHSDGIQTNKEGWMIDNIITGYYDVGTGISTFSSPGQVQVLPNPLTHVSEVVFAKDLSNFDFEIYDLQGRIVFRRQVDQNRSLLLNRTLFAKGIYLWSAKSDDNLIQTGKLVVE